MMDEAKADILLERRRLRRRLAAWRIGAIVLAVIAILLLIPFPKPAPLEVVARVDIAGVIVNDPDREEFFAELAKDDSVKAVILRIDSPGGTVVGSEALYEGIRALSEKKPVVAVMGEVAASGAYIAAIATDRIVARGNTMTGSIGVIAQIPNVEGLLEMAGIEVTQVRSSPLKAEPGFTQRPSPEGLAAEEELIEDAYQWFRGLVAERRTLDGAGLDRVADGRVFTGRQALDLGLIDSIGDENAARAWLAEIHGIEEDLPAVDRDWREEDAPWPFSMADALTETLHREAGRLTGGPRLYAVIH